MASKVQLSFTLVKTALVACALMALFLAAAQSVGAQPKDTSAAGTSQVLMCEGLGGKATVGTDRTPGGGLLSTTVKCSGGMADGLSCTNDQSGSNCSFKGPAPKGSKRPSLADIEAGTVDLAKYRT